MHLHQPPDDSIVIQSCPQYLCIKLQIIFGIIQYTKLVLSNLKFTFSPTFSTLITASQNGLYSNFPVSSEQGNWAYRNCRLLNRPQTINTIMVLAGEGCVGSSLLQMLFLKARRCLLISPRLANPIFSPECLLYTISSRMCISFRSNSTHLSRSGQTSTFAALSSIVSTSCENPAAAWT